MLFCLIPCQPAFNCPLLSWCADIVDLKLSEAEMELVSGLNRDRRRFGNPDSPGFHCMKFFRYDHIPQ